MPFVDHNPPYLRLKIEFESKETRRLLRRVRRQAEQVFPYQQVKWDFIELARHARLLAQYIRAFTVRHDYVDIKGNVIYSSYEDVLQTAQDNLPPGPDKVIADLRAKYDLFQDMGFTKQEFNDLLFLISQLYNPNLKLRDAFNHFVDHVLTEMQADKRAVKPREILAGVGGVLVVAFDVAKFAITPEPIELASSCAGGIITIATVFAEVWQKLK